MKMRKSALAILPGLFLFATPALAQDQHAQHRPSASSAGVEAVLGRYKAAIESLDGSKTQGLFSSDSEVVENGKREGSFANYLAHHLGPELIEFRSFKFADYKVDVRMEGPLAIAIESYSFRVETKTGEAIERQGVATSVLKRVGESWQIISMHSSSRKPKPKS
ncbi:nuclear transport factor 2 family protein [Sphingomonas koreensis]|nr:nuclear transport factor 2 family protein [Sphingomonas koreensis]